MLGLAALVARLAAWRGVDPLRAAAFVALNPLVLVHVVGGAHNDGLTMLLAMLGVAAVLARREASGGAALVAAAAIKASAALRRPVRPARHRQAQVSARRSRTGEFGPLGDSRWGRRWRRRRSRSPATSAFGWDWLHALGLAGREPGPDEPPQHPDHRRPARRHRRRPGPRRGAGRSTRVALACLLGLDLARRRLDPRRRLGRLRPAARHLLAAALVPRLAAAPSSPSPATAALAAPRLLALTAYQLAPAHPALAESRCPAADSSVPLGQASSEQE